MPTLEINTSLRIGRLLLGVNDAGRVEVTACREDRCVLVGDFDPAQAGELRDWLNDHFPVA